jgi:hypothetical protein
MSNNQDNISFNIGDVIVGSADPSKSVYSATGSKLIPNGVRVYGDEEVVKTRQKEFFKMAQNHGGVLLNSSSAKPTVNNGKFKKAKKVQPKPIIPHYMEDEFEEVQEEISPKPAPKNYITVQFENSFGKMKAKVLHVIEHEQAYLLIFENEDAVVFEPKTGETLTFHTPHQKNQTVYYPGVTFNSPQGAEKFMILFKSIEEN